MNKFSLRGVAIALVATFSIGSAQAATITGELFIGGEAVAIPGPGLGDAIGLAFTQGLLVTGATGDFAADGLAFGSTGSINDFLFGDVPIEPLLVVGSFTFDLTEAMVVVQGPDFLDLTGAGLLSGAGFDDTPYDFSLSADGAGNLFSFSATLAPTVIPVPGALILLMSGLAALGIRRRS